MVSMRDDRRKSGPRKGTKGEAAERERRSRQAELLRINLLKRKEQSRNRTTDAPPPPNSGTEPDTG
jgi:hypothetical protein